MKCMYLHELLIANTFVCVSLDISWIDHSFNESQKLFDCYDWTTHRKKNIN